MTGFADTLIARARGAELPAELSTIRPRVPAVFETPQETGGIEITESARSAAPPTPFQPESAPPPARHQTTRLIEQAAQTLPHAGTTPPSQRVEWRGATPEREFHGTLVEREPARQEWPATAQATPVQAREPREIPPQLPSQRTIHVETRVVTERERVREIETAGPGPAPGPARSPALPVPGIQPLMPAEKHRDPSPPPSRRKASAVAMARNADAKSAVPDVQITIGRIEIRATNPPPPMARRSQPQAMSLDEYRRRSKEQSR